MERIVEFIGNHPLLVLATVVVAVTLLVTEIRRLKAGPSSLDPSAATLLFNREGAIFVDVRPEADYRKAHLPGALHVSASALEQSLDRLKRYQDKPIIVYCNTGMSTGRVVAQLKKRGFDRVYQLRGGLTSWQEGGFPVESK